MLIIARVHCTFRIIMVFIQHQFSSDVQPTDFMRYLLILLTINNYHSSINKRYLNPNLLIKSK